MNNKKLSYRTIFITGFFLLGSWHLKGATSPYKAIPLAAAAGPIDELFSFNKKTKKYECGVCDKHCGRKNHIKSHIAVHFTKKDYLCGYKNPEGTRCRSRFKRKDIRERHVAEQHLNKRLYDCEDCGQEFKRKEHLESHEEKIYKKKPVKKRIERKRATLDDQEDDDDEYSTDETVFDDEDETITDKSEDESDTQPVNTTLTPPPTHSINTRSRARLAASKSRLNPSESSAQAAIVNFLANPDPLSPIPNCLSRGSESSYFSLEEIKEILFRT